MAEIINSYNLENLEVAIPMDRDEFYKEQIECFKEKCVPTKAVEVVNIFLFNESWEFILQKRASKKAHNANLIDKSIWWHITHWDEPDFTVMVESVQELKVPSIVLRSHADFVKTYSLLSNYLTSTALIEYVNTKMTYNTKIINWEKIQIANKTHFYVWVYGWSVKNVDREAKWILFYSWEDLEDEMKEFPNMFTEDIHFFIREYKNYFKEFLKVIKD